MELQFDEKKPERAVLVGLNADCFTQQQTATDETLEELEALLETAGGFCTGKILQNRHTPDAHSFIGEGKAQEVKMLCELLRPLWWSSITSFLPAISVLWRRFWA